jgi:hypothetical protein
MVACAFEQYSGYERVQNGHATGYPWRHRPPRTALLGCALMVITRSAGAEDKANRQRRRADFALIAHGAGFGEYELERTLRWEAKRLVVAGLARLRRSATELGAILDWFTRSEARLVAVTKGDR